MINFTPIISVNLLTTGINREIHHDSLPAGTILWNKTYPCSGHQEGSGIDECSDGSFIVTGMSDDDIYLMKTDSSGNQLWNKTYDSGYDDYGRDVVECPDGGFAIGGNIGSKVILLKTSASGIQQWNLTFLFQNTLSMLSRMIECSDGGFALVGYTAGVGGWIVRTTADGTKLWNVTYEITSTAFYTVTELSNGYIVAGGHNYENFTIQTGVLLCVDQNGSEVWSKQLAPETGIYAIASCKNGDLFVHCTNGSTPMVSQFYRFTNQGSLLWLKEYYFLRGPSIYRFIECPDQSIVGVGKYYMEYNNMEPRYIIKLLKLDAEGAILSNSSYDIPALHIGFDRLNFVECSNDDYAIIGTLQNDDIFLLRLDDSSIGPSSTLSTISSVSSTATSSNANEQNIESLYIIGLLGVGVIIIVIVLVVIRHKK